METNRLIYLLLSVAINLNVLIAKTYKYNAFFTHADATFNPSSANFTINIENKTLLNVEGDIFEKLSDPVYKVVVTYEREGKKMTFLDREMSFCTIGTIFTLNSLTRPYLDTLRKQSNWNFVCPVSIGHYYTKKFEVEHYMDLAFPPAVFKVELEMKKKLKQALKTIFKLTIDGVYKLI